MAVLLSKNAWFTDGVRRSPRLNHHTSDRLGIMHVLQISKVEVRVATMPESEIQWASTDSIGRLGMGNNNMTIEVPSVIAGDCGSEVKVIEAIEHDLVILNGDAISLHSSQEENCQKIAAKIRDMEDIMEDHWLRRYTSNHWLKLH